MDPERTGVRSSLRAPDGLGRVIGRAAGTRTGPTLLTMGGIHGNEPAGVLAAIRVHEHLADLSPELRGEIVSLAGNLEALKSGVRFVDQDLNRAWLPENILALAGTRQEDIDCNETRQLMSILETVDTIIAAARGPLYFLDLHTCSAQGTPFLTLGDTLRNRRFALGIPLPLVLGLEEQVDGSLLEYLNNLGVITLGAEGGQHDDPQSVDYLESVIWAAMVSAGLLEASAVPNLREHRRRLEAASGTVPRVVEVRHRHPTTDGDGFEMLPGFANIHPIRKGQLLAQDSQSSYYALENGLLLLPRYQGQGNDGYFLARRVEPVWLWVSTALRRLHIDRLAPLLPGIRKHPEREGTLVVDTQVAFFYPMEIFHLLGYRKVRRNGPELLVSRRVFDLHLPETPATA